MQKRRDSAFGYALILSCVLVACTDDPPRDHVLGDDWTPTDRDAGRDDGGAGMAGTGDAATAGAGGAPGCLPILSSEPFPARDAVMSGAGITENTGVFTTELYGRFVDYCGSCHTQGRAQGGFDVSRATFVERITDEVIMRARSNDPDVVMPPMSVPFAMRDPSSPLVQFVELLTQWYEAGKPPDVFYPTAIGGGSSGASPYQLSKSVGMALTNIGNCVPTTSMVATRPEAASALDEKFAAMQTFDDLPKSLRDTDLFTLDGAELARHGVIAFAPTYTLWADNAKKIRMIRVPVGESVRFDRDTQSFDIPANTRFYKTFLKPVTDLQGNVRYRKMETRIIVSRPDRELADGSAQYTALFGSYKWNDAETEATLHDIPYRDGEGFTDDLRVYVVDERLEDEIVRAAPPDVDQALLAAGARRSYPIPGADRCVDCHMGSKSFIFGFTPLQVRRRPLGEGGVIEPAIGDELDQLQRLIDYGVVTGMNSPDEVVLLEDTQGSRKPRNEHELNAQGYMVGNCAHCHNPRGFPSRREPVLRDVLDFMPSITGGIFQFPLDKVSPRTFRGEAQDIRIPYITPSLFDHPRAVQSNDELTGAISRSNKWIAMLNPTAGESAALSTLAAWTTVPPTLENPEPPSAFPGISAMELSPGRPLLAPWRSLIYRNVDAPFSYEDGGTIFPRMPMDTPGYDCRVRRLMGSWMVSIPARRTPTFSAPRALEQYEEMSGMEDQPYVEVRPTDPDYDEYASRAAERLEMFRRSERYFDCPSPDLDGVAPEVSSGRSVLPYAQVTQLTDAHDEPSEFYDLLSAARPHYPKTDLRDDPNWIIRRPDWPSVLAINLVDEVKASSNALVALTSRQTISAVRELQITPEVESFLLTARPMGLWQNKAECADALSNVPRAGDFSGADRPSWMSLVGAAADAPVYMASAGEQIFGMICSRCHGPLANGKSALATTIADLTGGLTRVANLRDGLVGPPTMPSTAWQTAFSNDTISAYDRRSQAESNWVAWTPETDTDPREWAARYVAWMGLGGTNAQIPATVLTRLRSGEVMGERPQGTSLFRPSPADAANMLTVAKLACGVFLPSQDLVLDAYTGRFLRESSEPSEVATLQDRGLIVRNGVAELWESMCHFNNPAPLRVLTPRLTDAGDARLVAESAYGAASSDPEAQPYYGIVDRSAYPMDALVGDQTGAIVHGIQADNLAPWCIGPIIANNDAESVRVALTELAVSLGRTFDTLPWCPQQVVSGGRKWTVAEGSRWAIRGAANAGLAVFLYLDALSRGVVHPRPGYDRCEDL